MQLKKRQYVKKVLHDRAQKIELEFDTLNSKLGMGTYEKIENTESLTQIETINGSNTLKAVPLYEC